MLSTSGRKVTGVLLLVLVVEIGAQYDYGKVISKSLLFYEAQRTGKLPASNRVPWRRDTFLGDKGDNHEDLSGGYFDAGDFVKFGFPFASAMTMMGWGLVDSAEGFRKAGEWENALGALRWGMDYMIKNHPSPDELYVQVGDGKIDHSYWGRPEDWPITQPRPTLKATTSLPASEVAGEQSAAMTAASMAFREAGDTQYADLLLRHARELYYFATNYRGNYSESFPEVAEYYKSYSGYGDEFGWSAAWLYRATSEKKFKTDYEKWWSQFKLNSLATEASWDWKQAHTQVLLAKVDGGPQYVTAATRFCDWLVNTCPKTPKGLAFISQWGSLRHAANAAYLCMQAANSGIKPDEYRAFAKKQIDYMLGDSGRSFVVGFGTNPPQRPHHASSSCPHHPAPCGWSDFFQAGPNPQVLYGALVGGPDENDTYVDDREDYVDNEVTLDYNAGFQSALAEICSRNC